MLLVGASCTTGTTGAARITGPYSGIGPTGSVVTQTPETAAPVRVPEVVGMTGATARQRLRARGLVVRAADKRIDAVSPGTVISQRPRARALVPPGTIVRIVIARAPPSPSPTPTIAPTSCPSDPLRGVYHPYRLTVLGQCRTFHGVVLFVRHEDDGDYHVVVAPDPGYESFLNSVNRSEQHGGLVTEIMPGQRFPQPYVGEHISVFGTWVLDTMHGWREIHPIWAITDLSTGRRVFSLPVVPPRYG